MTLLLDTHALLWLLNGSDRLGPRARATIHNDDVRVSAVTVWEISIKHALGRIPGVELDSILDTPGFPELPFCARHALAAGSLPPHHRDPFDRALVAQAQIDGLILVTSDPHIPVYEVAVLDASR